MGEGMKKEEFYYDSRDGVSKIHAVRYTPDDKTKIVGVLQIIHGMAEYIERYEETAAFFVERGFVVTGNDHLGHGLSVGEEKRYGYFCEQDPATVVVRDVHRLKKMTQQLYPDAPIILMGHSMGSFILRGYLCRYGTGIQGAVVMGTGTLSPAMVKISKAMVAIQRKLVGPKHISYFLNKMTFGKYNEHFQPQRTPVDWLSRNGANVDRYIADPLCGFVFTVNGFSALAELNERMIDPENIKNVPDTLPILFVSGTEDPVGDYGAGVQRTYDLLQAAGLRNMSVKMYKEDRHEILNEADGDVVRQDILDWIMEKVLSEKRTEDDGVTDGER